MPVSAPTITRTRSGNTSKKPLDPFSGDTIDDPNAGATDTLTIRGPGGALSGTGLSGANGTHTLAGAASAITAELRALSFTPVGPAPGSSTTTTFTLSDASSAHGAASYNAVPQTLASFAGAANISSAGLTIDAAGDLFGTTEDRGAHSYGSVFEIAHGSSTVTTLWSFTGGAGGSLPAGDMVADAAGDLFGTIEYGGANGVGAVFEIAAGSSTPAL